jgi:hypothetical protein
MLACQPAGQEATTEEADTTAMAETAAPEPGSRQWKIQNAMSAAPPEIAANATIMDWPAAEGGEPTVLQPGTNGWTCFPNTPAATGASGDDPMCLDGAWLAFADAWMKKTTPNITSVGLGYMLQGDRGGSNTDPYATGPTPDNQWVTTGPHIMLVVPDTRLLDVLPTDPQSGGPFVMWKGTPYAHVMMPVGPKRTM